MDKLVIWDFDGVVSDTEQLWIETRQLLLNRYFKLNWDFETTINIWAEQAIKLKEKF